MLNVLAFKANFIKLVKGRHMFATVT